MPEIEQHIEALIFASEQSIRLPEILYCLQAALHDDILETDVREAINNIAKKYNNPELAIELVYLNNGYQFLTKKQYHEVISQLQLQQSKKKLSQAALETLAIVAYKQPITKLEIEQIRGVNCDYTLQKLLEKELIIISGKADTIGRPLLYSTSGQFADYMGISNIDQLPKPSDMNPVASTIGSEQE
ncbi:SMC-Scp complex subunit ScpB [Mucilaginibacter robiniae]|uniref:SMC-Scp complex subunit ScpB n=1 Tax=Mucilaginibacter robiniae TaxID=2728022 RepID=A0A7L5E3K4_9SPHI|nr:SMC-Scp complex subunit ScpB [Mucilaginibacter robiniae]QJD97940.1 SMC-Scp complex subunit ScpB [Mucilaginibacter robiniae]